MTRETCLYLWPENKRNFKVNVITHKLLFSLVSSWIPARVSVTEVSLIKQIIGKIWLRRMEIRFYFFITFFIASIQTNQSTDEVAISGNFKVCTWLIYVGTKLKSWASGGGGRRGGSLAPIPLAGLGRP
jgi:hypothetical protein